MPEPKLAELLADIRETQSNMLQEYRRVANESLELQKAAFENQQRALEQQARAVLMQAQAARLYRIVVAVAGAVVLTLAAFLVLQLSAG